MRLFCVLETFSSILCLCPTIHVYIPPTHSRWCQTRYLQSQTRWPMPVIQALRRLKQEAGLHNRTLSQNKNERMSPNNAHCAFNQHHHHHPSWKQCSSVMPKILKGWHVGQEGFWEVDAVSCGHHPTQRQGLWTKPLKFPFSRKLFLILLCFQVMMEEIWAHSEHLFQISSTVFAFCLWHF